MLGKNLVPGITVNAVIMICMVLVFVIIIVVAYPQKWKNKRYIFGVRNREEFLSGETSEYITSLVNRSRRLALILFAVIVILSAFTLIIDSMGRQILYLYGLIYAAVILLYTPYIRGNYELKSLKSRLGIETGTGVKYTDITSITASHGLSKIGIIIPVLVNAVAAIIVFLYDLKLINLAGNAGAGYAGSYIATAIAGTFLFISLLFLPIAFMMDNFRNQIISEDSTENSNFNRAKKKLWGDTWIRMTWLNAFTAIASSGVAIMIFGNEMAALVLFFVYFASLIIILGILINNSSKLEEKYGGKFGLEGDDDDKWILGMFYYNPSDTRLNVARRDETGGTINLAHPAGKVISVIAGLLLTFAFGMIIMAARMDETPLSVKVADGQIVCRQLKDDYRIEMDDIQDVSYGENLDSLKLVRTTGYAMENVLKGRFTVDGTPGCRLFVNPNQDSYVRIVTNDRTYYISGNSLDETERIYEEITEGD